MVDGREPDLATQAGNAIRNHAQGIIPPDRAELDAIARFDLTGPFFSSSPLRDFARGGPAPLLPAGTTDSEIRGHAQSYRSFQELQIGHHIGFVLRGHLKNHLG